MGFRIYRLMMMSMIYTCLCFLATGDSGILGYYRWPTQTWPYIKRVNFQSPFKQPPKLTYGFYFLDSSHTKNLRVVAKTSKVTNTGFQVIMNPWHDTVLYGAKISWMACGYWIYCTIFYVDFAEVTSIK